MLHTYCFNSAILLLLCLMPVSLFAKTNTSSADGTDSWVTYEVGGKVRLRSDTFDDLYSNDGTKVRENYLRRADFEVKGLFFQSLDYEFELKADHEGEVSVKTATLGYKFPYGFSLAAGRLDPDFGLEMTGSSAWATGVERSSVWDLAPDAGDGAEGEGVVFRQVGKHHFLSLGGFDLAEYSTINARAVYVPIEKKKHVLHIGFSYSDSQGFEDDGRIRSDLSVRGVGISDNGNSTQLARAKTDAAFDDDKVQVIELAYLRGPFSIQAEQLERQLSAVIPSNNREATGRYAQVAYTLTGEHRSYKMDTATFGKIKPKNADWGAWEIFYRKDWLSTEGEAGLLSRQRSQGDAEVDVLGVNWYWNEHAKFSANYLEGYAIDIPNDTDDEKGRAMTLQILLYL